MNLNKVQIIFASIALLATAVLAQVLAPRELMARSSPAPKLENVIPKQFGTWTLVPDLVPVTPAETDEDAVPDANWTKPYSQEVGRSYTDGHGNIVMLMVAYGPVQNFRLHAHRPEICYTASGFRVSGKTTADVAYRDDVKPIRVARLLTERESRFEPVSYWMRVGHDTTTGVIDYQLARFKYGLRGIIPDGALVRVSTVGLSAEVSYRLQDKFIRDLLTAIPDSERKFFTGST